MKRCGSLRLARIVYAPPRPDVASAAALAHQQRGGRAVITRGKRSQQQRKGTR